MSAAPVVADRVVHEVADGLLEQRGVHLGDDRIARHGEVQLDAGGARGGLVAIDQALDERDEVGGPDVHDPAWRLEFGRRRQVAEDRAQVIRLADRRGHVGASGVGQRGLALERAQVALQHAERRGDVVAGVRDELAERLLAAADLGELAAQAGAGVVEG